ncbi:MAG: hypothetical protein UY28_C0032G0013 [Candidatus Amesbacteria bacterium GW2011_GWB1_48_13]|uniref:Prepilin-type N-terminal cleavage/methylation domain-containing protein n=1 Tax=Candidatus Amesbacteria bacterium GW2011_GWB1_48_13 TaxID=1618362 RepID=A0A0G1UR76_9BACT|nr:MAG: hypothetical protein UY28_C0032G0013 [Candidatus Amesbacteria bacterium GW2011_GWB1_48_13]
MFWLPGILPAEEYGDTICIVRVFKRGFTLIELLVVIGVLAVIAAGVVALINPQDKIAHPDAPAEYAPYEYTTNAGADARICGQVKAKKYVNQGWNRWRWDSGSGKTCAVVNCADACP